MFFITNVLSVVVFGDISSDPPCTYAMQLSAYTNRHTCIERTYTHMYHMRCLLYQTTNAVVRW